MKTTTALVSLAVAVGISAPAMAETGVYANGGYTHYDTNDITLGGVTGRVGYRFHPNLAVEGEATFGVKDDEVGAATVELDHAIGAYAVGILPLAPNFDVFGRVGYAQIKASASAPGIAVSADEDGVGYGAGAQYMFTPKFGVRGEYTRLEGEDDGVNSYSAAAVVKF